MTPTPTPLADHVALEEDHHHRSRRERYALRTIKADVVCRIVLIAVRLVFMPFAVRLLDLERYGLWLTAGSVLTWLNLSQMGLGDGLGILYFTGANLPIFTLAMALPPLVVTAGLTICLFGWRHFYLRPRLSLFDRDSLPHLMNFGGPLTVVQIADLGIFNSSTPLIAFRLGVAEVPRYAVALSIFMLVSNF